MEKRKLKVRYARFIEMLNLKQLHLEMLLVSWFIIHQRGTRLRSEQSYFSFSFSFSFVKKENMVGISHVETKTVLLENGGNWNERATLNVICKHVCVPTFLIRCMLENCTCALQTASVYNLKE